MIRKRIIRRQMIRKQITRPADLGLFVPQALAAHIGQEIGQTRL
ncbi:hypothetical protein [Bradyrhizobium phage BDU-MI-1]|nr:hypothetical protein [Bradyrhizobium phage BDU-MI-1]